MGIASTVEPVEYATEKKEDEQKKEMKKIEFFHFRQADERENEETVLPTGGVTVCYLPEGDTASYGVSMCSPGDNYNKKKGSVRAKGTATSNLKNSVTDMVYPIGTREDVMAVAIELAQKVWTKVNMRRNRPITQLILKTK